MQCDELTERVWLDMGTSKHRLGIACTALDMDLAIGWIYTIYTMSVQHQVSSIAASFFSSLLPFATCNDVHDCRTVPAIAYTCVSTIFLCTWASLHLNVPKDPWEAWWRRFVKRTGWMVMALLAPEVVLLRALRQWTRSCADLKAKCGEILLGVFFSQCAYIH